MLLFPNNPADGEESLQSTGIIYVYNLALTRWDIKLAEAYPVGSVYMAVVLTNPSVLLGYGTWAKLAEGRTLIGDGSGSGLTTRVGGVEGGAENAVLPQHNHSFPAHNHGASSGTTGSSHTHTLDGETMATTPDAHDVLGPDVDDHDIVTGFTNNDGTHTHTLSVANVTGNSGSAGSDSLTQMNMMPFKAVAMWERLS